ncbi:MAG: transporter substrate-binding domain-containing protein [Candidatus Cloacimonetes bacterium]|jgi:polar amino acid transport system substrate-binding protein|nr:transporter substrate-binding domain-containing protein [Candidatus Cloacimonadota bacterium]
MLNFKKLQRVKTKKIVVLGLSLLIIGLMGSCAKREKITELSQLKGKEIGVPMGTIADKLVLSKFPNTTFKYYNNIMDACLAVKTGKVDAAAYDEPILRNIAAKNQDLMVFDEMITLDSYGFAVRLTDYDLKNTIDIVLEELKDNGLYEDMHKRWLPEIGNPAPMPEFHYASDDVIRFGTSSVTEPFSFVDKNGQVVGLDIEIANYIAMKLNKKLEIVNMEFGSLIPALAANKVDFIGACITISEERAKSVLFSDSYYIGGIAAIVKKVQ